MRRLLILVRAAVEYSRTSIFFVPVGFILAAAGLAWVTLVLDERIEDRADIPDLLISTVDSSRALLSTVAGATLTFAAISISISLLLTQMATSQFSPRVAYSYFRDPATRWVLGVVVGTFTYCLIVLRTARAASVDGEQPSIPRLSTLVATGLGILSVMAIVWLVNHTAQSMRVEEIVDRIARSARRQIEEGCPLLETAGETPAPPDDPTPVGPALEIRAEDEGWVRQLDLDGLIRLVPAGGLLELTAHSGGFVTQGATFARLWPVPEEPDEVEDDIRGAMQLGPTRTTQQDIGFGLRQLVDVALRALSPGINDPTTAIECVVHLGSVLRALVPRRVPPAVVHGEDGRRIVLLEQPDFEGYVELAFGQMRLVAQDPDVFVALVDVLGMLVAEASTLGWQERAEALRRQANLVLDSLERADLMAADAERVLASARLRGLR